MYFCANVNILSRRNEWVWLFGVTPDHPSYTRIHCSQTYEQESMGEQTAVPYPPKPPENVTPQKTVPLTDVFPKELPKEDTQKTQSEMLPPRPKEPHKPKPGPAGRTVSQSHPPEEKGIVIKEEKQKTGERPRSKTIAPTQTASIESGDGDELHATEGSAVGSKEKKSVGPLSGSKEGVGPPSGSKERVSSREDVMLTAEDKVNIGEKQAVNSQRLWQDK
ncbi:hypothetical protein OSTOST_20684 [Ostertagia ostertagi]